MSIKPGHRVQQIEGLRAVSVLLVLVYHIDKSWLPSGYLGVDAFFGISGYVVTRMIAARQESGLFTLLGFYASRIARLLPSLLVVILLSLVAFSIIYGQNDLQNLSFSAIASTVSLSNVFFYFDSGYFSEEAIYKPLLHTWSLGVEEQFYLIWPALLIMFARRRLLTSFFMFLSGVSFFIATAIVSTIDSDLTFYFSPFRMHQFLFGAGFALLTLERAHRELLPQAKLSLEIIIIALMVSMSLLEYSFGPAQTVVQTAMAFLAAAACFMFDRNQSATNLLPPSILGQQPITYIGSRSYAIYLVHWPLIAAANEITGNNNTNTTNYYWLLFIASILFGVMLSALVERPLRFKKHDSKSCKQVKLLITMGLVIVSLSGSALILVYPLLEESTSKSIRSSSKLLRNDLINAIGKPKCYFKLIDKSSITPKLVADCIVPNKKNVLVVGDSLSRGTYLGLKETYENINFTRIYVNGCPPYFGKDYNHIQAMSNVLKGCSVVGGNPWGYVKEIIRDAQFDSIVVAGYWQAKMLGLSRVVESVKELNKIGQPVGFLGVRPSFSRNVIRLYENGDINPSTKNNIKSYLYTTKGFPSSMELDSELKTTMEKYSNIQYLDILSALCPDDCPAFILDNMLYLDDKHLTLFGSNYLADELEVYKPIMNKLEYD